MKPKFNKKICKECYRIDGWNWSIYDEGRWNMGVVVCRCLVKVSKLDKVPEGCPYALEHVVIGNDDEA